MSRTSTEKKHAYLELPLTIYSAARSAGFTLQFTLLETLGAVLPTAARKTQNPDVNLISSLEVRQDLIALFRKDAQNISHGLYPLSVLKPESPVEHFLRIPKLMADGFSLYLRRKKGRTTVFTERASALLAELPKYYRRNFHFQTDGYLSDKSAELYEHQVELLFRGGADAMRRLIIPALHRHFGSTDGKGLRFLEVGAGTGRTTRFVSLAFPKARIVACDLSEPYLKNARKRLADINRIDYVQSDGAKLPFNDGHFDAVFSVFLFHELPYKARQEILAEASRVLKPGGFVGMVDSIQTGDKEAFDPLLFRFPQDFHEPFFRDYIARPMEKLFKGAGFKDVKTDRGFFSKAVAGVRPA